MQNAITAGVIEGALFILMCCFVAGFMTRLAARAWYTEQRRHLLIMMGWPNQESKFQKEKR